MNMIDLKNLKKIKGVLMNKMYVISCPDTTTVDEMLDLEKRARENLELAKKGDIAVLVLPKKYKLSIVEVNPSFDGMFS